MTPNLVLKAYLNIPIYDHKLTLYVVQDGDKTLRRLANKFDIDYNKDKGFGALTLSYQCEHAVILHINDLSEKTVTHEAKHINDYLMDSIGKKTCKKCRDEPEAYLIGYLKDWLTKKLAPLAKLKV